MRVPTNKEALGPFWLALPGLRDLSPRDHEEPCFLPHGAPWHPLASVADPPLPPTGAPVVDAPPAPRAASAPGPPKAPVAPAAHDPADAPAPSVPQSLLWRLPRLP